jgi:adenylate cyclase
MHRPRIRQSNWDAAPVNDFRDHRRQLAVLDTSGGRIPSISRNPPTATSPTVPYYSGTNGTAMPASVTSFFNDSNEELAQLSPGFRPGSGRDDHIGFPGDGRRPSTVSTVSSSGSKSSSRGYHKPLKNIFGDDFPGDSRQNSDTSLTTPYTIDTQSARSTRHRNNSLTAALGNSLNSRPSSPAGSRPRTPLPSSEVTPWEFQDYYKVSCHVSLQAVAAGVLGSMVVMATPGASLLPPPTSGSSPPLHLTISLGNDTRCTGCACHGRQ